MPESNDNIKRNTNPKSFAMKEDGLLYNVKAAELESGVTMIQPRRCHDCGKPTYNYRCAKCWKKYKEKHKLAAGENDEEVTYTVVLSRKTFS